MKFQKILIVLLLLGFTGFIYAEKTRDIIIAGFINGGDKADNNINLVITKSLGTFLNKLPGIRVIPTLSAEKDPKIKAYISAKTIEADSLLDIGLTYQATTVIGGDYSVDQKKNSVKFNIEAYDTVSGELKLKRTYEGGAGPDIFDTIDKTIKNVSSLLLGKNVDFAVFKASIDGTDKAYQLYLNGKLQKEIRKGDGYEDKVPSGQDLAVIIRKTGGNEVYHGMYNLKTAETGEIKYVPSGMVEIRKDGAGGSRVILDGKPAGEVGVSGILKIPLVRAGVLHMVKLEKSGKNLLEESFTLEEGSTKVIGDSPLLLSFPVRLLHGGLGATVGFEAAPLAFLRFGLAGGAVYLKSTIIPTAEANLSLKVIAAGDFRLFISGGAFLYASTPLTISPLLKVEAGYGLIFLEAGARYSLEDGGIYPAGSIGIRF